MTKKNLTVDNALDMARKDWEKIFENQNETTMPANKEPDFNTLVVQKCLTIVRNNKKVVVSERLGVYTVRRFNFFRLTGWDDIFDIQDCTSCLPEEYWLTINGTLHHIPMNTPGVRELYLTCIHKYCEKTQQRENAALKSLDAYDVSNQANKKVGLWKRVFGRQR